MFDPEIKPGWGKFIVAIILTYIVLLLMALMSAVVPLRFIVAVAVFFPILPVAVLLTYFIFVRKNT